MADTLSSTNGQGVVTDTDSIVVNEVTYGAGGRWGQWAAGAAAASN